MFLDDGTPEEHDETADARFRALTPEQQTFAGMEVQALGLQAAAKGMYLGQTRSSFLVSMAAAWDEQRHKLRMATGT